MMPRMPKPTQMLRRIDCSMVGLPPFGPTVRSFITILPTVWPRLDSM